MTSTSTDGSFGLASVIQRASASTIIFSIFAILVIRWVVRAFLRVYFHPLSHIPGPKFSAATRIPQVLAAWNGTTHVYLREIHRKYGSMVRIAPDEVSFINPDAWRDIDGHGSKNTRGSRPHKHWTRYPKNPNESFSLIQSRDADHARMRRVFTPAFSQRALKQQEPLFLKYANLLVQKLNEALQEEPGRKIDMSRMYNFTTFDVMGDLTFGEPLHMLANAEYDPWVSIIFGSIKTAIRFNILQHYPYIFNSINYIFKEGISKMMAKHLEHTNTRVTKRIEKGRDSEGVDVWDLVLKQEDGKGLTRGEMNSNAALFMVAGTESTATVVSGLTYLLLKNPEPKEKLIREIRGSFASSADMSMDNTEALPYLNACLKETLRLYPPVPIGLPRMTPADGSTICGEYIPPGFTVGIPQWAMYTSESNFKESSSFIPERWTGDERFKDDQRATVQAFSVGSRDCLGKNMAYHEMRLIMAKVLYNFDFELCPESDNWMDQKSFTLWQRTPLICKLKAVN